MLQSWSVQRQPVCVCVCVCVWAFACRYEDNDLTARTFALIERLTSKREKLLGELMRTFVVTDEDLVALAEVAGNHVSFGARLRMHHETQGKRHASPGSSR